MTVGGAVGIHAAAAHGEAIVIAGNPVDRTPSAEIAERLPRRIHLIGSDGHRQFHLLFGFRIDFQPIGDAQVEVLAGTFHPRPDRQPQSIGFPMNFRQWRTILNLGNMDFRIRPGDELAADLQEWLQ